MIWDIDLCGNITKACTRVNFFVYLSWANLFIKRKIDMYIYLKPFFNIQRSFIIFTIVDDEHMFNYCRFAGPSSYQWRHNGLDGVSNHQPYDCLLKLLFRRRTKKASKLCVTGLWVGKFTGNRWIPRTKGQYRGQCFHLMTSSCPTLSSVGFSMPFNPTWTQRRISELCAHDKVNIVSVANIYSDRCDMLQANCCYTPLVPVCKCLWKIILGVPLLPFFNTWTGLLFRFRANLEAAGKKMKAAGVSRTFPYNILWPEHIPNAISI